MSLNVCIAGATGWVGRPLSAEVYRADDLKLVGAVSRSHQAENLGGLLHEPGLDLVISASVAEALDRAQADVLVDYTGPEVVKANVLAAIDKGVHVVIGTSGLADDDFNEIDRAAIAKRVGVIAAGNFAITAVLLQRFAREAARYLSHWEIIDYASATKVDAPSGTTRELAFHLAQVREPETVHPVEKTVGLKESRGATVNGSQIHSIRLPSYVIAVEVIFGEEDERLTIRHDAGAGAKPYLQGTLLAIRKVKNVVGLVRGLDSILD
ncbi:MAG: 4-hydroxy-tetrahydrodipicolinate reductase [Pyrinomonadaceae bacterium]